jgi:hypothetical protein
MRGGVQCHSVRGGGSAAGYGGRRQSYLAQRRRRHRQLCRYFDSVVSSSNGDYEIDRNRAGSNRKCW